MLPLAAQGTFFQLGYVTRDIVAARELFLRRHGVPGFLEFDTSASPPAGRGGIKVALGYSRGVMIELIEPDPCSPGIYGEALSDTAPAALHHLGFLIDREAFDAHAAELARAEVPVPVLSRDGGMCLLYADTRADNGLYMELVVPTDAACSLFAAIPGAAPGAGIAELLRRG